MMKNNYKDYDKLSLYVKRTKVEEIVAHYKAFGWELEERTDNARYEDIEDLTFYRPHKIKNKDELQLMQVYMEERLNGIAKLEKNKNSKITILGLCFGILGLGAILAGISFLCNFKFVLAIIAEIALIVLGVATIICGIVLIPKIHKKEKEKYNQNHKRLETEINSIVGKANILQGETNEESK